MMRRYSIFVLLAFCLFAVPVFAEEDEKDIDPFEGYNRAMHEFNMTLDGFVTKPLAKGYRAVTPDVVEKGVSNFFSNLLYPTTIINQFLQGKIGLGVQDTARFVVNSTLGIGGIFDVAVLMGLERHQEDFGQTFAVWGVEESPYFVLPLFGPSTVRDGFGRVVDMYTNPIFYIEDNEVRYTLLGLSILDTRARFLDQEALLSGDEYLFIRDAYLQRRNYLINDKQPDEEDPFLDDDE